MVSELKLSVSFVWFQEQEGQHPLTGQRAPPISGGRDL